MVSYPWRDLRWHSSGIQIDDCTEVIPAMARGRFCISESYASLSLVLSPGNVTTVAVELHVGNETGYSASIIWRTYGTVKTR